MTEKAGNEVGVDPRLMDLASAPDFVRLKTLVALNERTAGAGELAEALGVDITAMRGHLERMCDQGLIEIVGGSLDQAGDEPRYRALVRALYSNEEWAMLGVETRRGLCAMVAQFLAADVEQAIEAGTFSTREESHTSRTLSVVDEQGWRELNRIQDEALEASFAVQAASAERLAESGEDGIRVMSAMLCFEMPAPGSS